MARITKDEVRAMRKSGDSTWEILAAVVHSGVEYPDAEHFVATALGMKSDEREQMATDYLECC